VPSLLLSTVCPSGLRLLTLQPVTPLDVVRVRLQSQPANFPSASRPSSLPAPPPGGYSFTNLPPNLGISTCCREVFWLSNNSQYCVVTPSASTAISDPAIKSAAACAAEEAQKKTFTSTFDGLRKIAHNEGLFTLWRGLSPTLVMAIPANVIYFAGYDWLRYNKRSPFRRINMPDTYVPLVAGSFARILAAIAVSPIEMFRTRMQAAHATAGKSGSYAETFQGIRDMIAVKGYRSMWTGLSLTLWRDVPFSAVYWWGYEYGRQKLRDWRYSNEMRQASLSTSESSRPPRASLSQEDHTTTLIDSFLAGASSGAFAALITTPFDVGKTRQQVVKYTASSTDSHAVNAIRPEEQSMPRFLWHIFKTQGTAGLFTGWAARCLKVAPACAIMISSYEIGKKMAGGINERRYSKGASDL